MNKTLLVLAIATLSFTACSKSSNTTPKTSSPVTLLSQVTNNIPGDPYIGKPLYQFTYSGKLLTQAVINHYSTPDVETDLFTYNSNSQLTGTTISHTLSNTYDDISSTVTYSGSNISEIKFYKAGNVLDQDIKLTYTNGKLTNWFNGDEVSDTYTYDSNGNNIQEVATEYQNGQPHGSVNTTTNSTFDSKSNLTQAVPMWIYFRVYTEDQCLLYAPGTNNPIASNDNGTLFTYTYQYNTYNYPSSASWTSSYAQAYLYQYTQVN